MKSWKKLSVRWSSQTETRHLLKCQLHWKQFVGNCVCHNIRFSPSDYCPQRNSRYNNNIFFFLNFTVCFPLRLRVEGGGERVWKQNCTKRTIGQTSATHWQHQLLASGVVVTSVTATQYAKKRTEIILEAGLQYLHNIIICVLLTWYQYFSIYDTSGTNSEGWWTGRAKRVWSVSQRPARCEENLQCAITLFNTAMTIWLR